MPTERLAASNPYQLIQKNRQKIHREVARLHYATKKITMALQRIVKMTFKSEHCKDFENYFMEIKDQVGSQPGCTGIKLLKDLSDSGIYFTYSNWDNEKSLDAYRETELFKVVWPKVKLWFAEKAEAWSTEILTESH